MKKEIKKGGTCPRGCPGYAEGKAYWEPSEYHKDIWRKEGYEKGKAESFAHWQITVENEARAEAIKEAIAAVENDEMYKLCLKKCPIGWDSIQTGYYIKGIEKAVALLRALLPEDKKWLIKFTVAKDGKK